MIPIAQMDARVLTALIVLVGVAVLGGLLIATAASELRGRRKAKIPAAFRPAPGDEELERGVLERTLMWAFLSTMLIALWIPVYWFLEPSRQEEVRAGFQTQAVTEGEHLYQELCATCHGDEAQGGPRDITADGRQLRTVAPALRFLYHRYQLSGRNDEEITQIVYDAINRGRPGTPMPTWSLAFGGPLNTQQVDWLVSYIQDIQEFIEPGPRHPAFRIPESGTGEAIYLANCAICHNTPDQVDEMTDNPGSASRLAGLGGIAPNLRVTLQRYPLRCPDGEPLCRDSVESIIRNGRINMTRTSMPAWEALGDDAIRALLTFIQSIQRG